MRPEMTLLDMFLAVAAERNFSAAAARLDVTRSAVSQAIRRLEDQMGTALVVRTTRSINLTEAGERLRASVAGPFAEIEAALDENAHGDAPSGLLRLAVWSIAERILSGPLITSFTDAHPRVSVDVTVTDEDFDITARGFDAGVRLREAIAQDMIAVPVGGEALDTVVASPSFVARHGKPEHPRDLVRFRCIGWRASPNTAPYRWQFTQEGQDFEVQVHPQITTNDPQFKLRAALAGAGIAFTTEEASRPYVDSGELVSLLDAFLQPYPGFFLFFPNRRHMAPKLRAFVDHLRAG